MNWNNLDQSRKERQAVVNMAVRFGFRKRWKIGLEAEELLALQEDCAVLFGVSQCYFVFA